MSAKIDAEVYTRLKEWKKCFSKSRQLDYYFHELTKESLWTLDEVKDRIRHELEQEQTSAKTNTNDVPKTTRAATSTAKTSKKPVAKKASVPPVKAVPVKVAPVAAAAAASPKIPKVKPPNKRVVKISPQKAKAIATL